METTGSKHIDALVADAVKGDGRSFTELWDTYIAQLRSYVKSRVKSLDDMLVEDICSRSFEKAFRQIGSFDPSKSQFFTWLRVIAKNVALDLLEQEQRLHPRDRVVYLDDGVQEFNVVADSIADRVDSPLESIIRGEDEQNTQSCIDALPELYRDVARKRLIDGMAYKEIAEATGLELNTVRTRLRRAKALIEEMKHED
ncbi:MAG: RNA polymerase sigma factor [Bacteroidales bacterium]|nr:RNA polymerase sigma factor [Bacteroidales bacterium]